LKISGYEIELVRLDVAFVHELQPGHRRLFLMVTEAVLLEEVDDVIGVPRWMLSEAWRVIGLPAVKADKAWVVPKAGKRKRFDLKEISFTAKRRGTAAAPAEDSQANDGRELLQCPWQISFM